MENLPVEIIHRIFDHLDIETIFFSIRPVCRLFRAIVQNYDQFDFHVKIISKSKFDVLCQYIAPENIRSLTLYNNIEIPDQISLFLSRICLQKLKRLHSIHLNGIDGLQLDDIFKGINLNLLKSFSIRTGPYDKVDSKKMMHHLSTIVKQSNLRNLDLKIDSRQISEMEWPMNCLIERLTLYHDMAFRNLMKMISCSSQLRRLIIKEKYSWSINDQIPRFLFPQLTSLILEHVNIPIDQLESFLLLTPSLVFFKLIGNFEMFDGKRWEYFIQVNLLHLNQFQFYITCRKSGRQAHEDSELVIQSYRSPFWIEYKKWFVTVELDVKVPRGYRIYSIPICKSLFECDLNMNKIFLSTLNDILMIENISQLDLRLKMSSTQSMRTSSNRPYFPNVTKLHIHFDRTVSFNLIGYLSKIINPLQLIEVKLHGHFSNHINAKLLYDLLKLLGQSSQLSSLVILYRTRNTFYPSLETIIGILPPQIKLLRMPINKIEQIEMIRKRCRHLAILKFGPETLKLNSEIKQWFKNNTINSIFERRIVSGAIWIGRKKEEEEKKFNHKRIKLTD